MALLETGTEPEFFVTHIAKAESVAGGCVRLYIASERNGELRLEYTVVVPVERLLLMSRECTHIATDHHNLAIWRSDLTEQ